MGVLRDLVDFFRDAFDITSIVLTSRWIWLMIGFGMYFLFQTWLMLAVSPLTLLIMPGILIVYLIVSENKRTAAQYSLNKKVVDTTEWNVSTAVDQYIKTITKVPILNEDREKDKQ